ncbi:unnamed protein product [Notodromas monacha]|uniref:Uncharacterized protein n=1 Tax=Notodromas monacha TaxID=399045 RepID=A0A7R9BT21_9CRUS|nr:unnamed protein product [Notodromas monacha]CAG0921218.1 unnamed protein product [Notodromas monacha]
MYSHVGRQMFGQSADADPAYYWRMPADPGADAKSIVQLQKRAFLHSAPFAPYFEDPSQQMAAQHMMADPLQPYAMGFDKETYYRVVVMPSTFMMIVIALLCCTMFTRFKQGKPITPWSSCPEYTDAGGESERL